MRRFGCWFSPVWIAFLLVLGGLAALAARVAVAGPTMWSRIIHARPSFALIGSWEHLMRQFRGTLPAHAAFAVSINRLTNAWSSV